MPQQPTCSEYLRKILLSPVYDVAHVTPLERLEKLSERMGNDVYLKREDLQPVHSFKLRGAYNKIAQLPEEAKARGVIAASAGNHAQGCALSGSRLGVKATIVMPKPTPDIKVDAVRRFGGIYHRHFGRAARMALVAAACAGLAGCAGCMAVPDGVFDPSDEMPVYEVVPLGGD